MSKKEKKLNIKETIKNNKLYKKIKKQISKINVEKNKFNTLELLLIFVMALLLGIVAGEMIFSGRDVNNISITQKINNNVSEIESIYNTLLEEYIDEIDEDQLKDAAINGMFSLLGDDFSLYYDEQASDTLKEELEGYFYGIGVEIYRDEESGKVIINKVFEGSPADKAGLQAGDEYLKVDNIDVSTKTLSEIAEIITKGDNKTYTITVKRDNQEIETKVTSGKVEIPSVASEVLEENDLKIGYIQISIFASNTDEQFEKHLKELENQNIDKLIIDVRSNSGGDLETVINIASNFLQKEDIIVQTVLNDEVTKRYSVKNSNKKYEIAILIDQGSASGAEVLASALNENLGSELIGQTTYGKGTVQKIKNLPSGGIIKYTTETWMTSQGKEINNIGIIPTIEVELNDKYYETLDKKDDTQLQKAIEILSQD